MTRYSLAMVIVAAVVVLVAGDEDDGKMLTALLLISHIFIFFPYPSFSYKFTLNAPKYVRLFAFISNFYTASIKQPGIFKTTDI